MTEEPTVGKKRGRPRKEGAEGVNGADSGEHLPLESEEQSVQGVGNDANGPPQLPTDTRHIDDPLISLPEMARRIGVDRTTVWRWWRDRLFVVVKKPNGLPMVRTSVANTFLSVTEIKARV